MLLLQKLQTEREMIQFCDSLDPECAPDVAVRVSVVDSEL